MKHMGAKSALTPTLSVEASFEGEEAQPKRNKQVLAKKGLTCALVF
jgi:hypothetical protein